MWYNIYPYDDFMYIVSDNKYSIYTKGNWQDNVSEANINHRNLKYPIVGYADTFVEAVTIFNKESSRAVIQTLLDIFFGAYAQGLRDVARQEIVEELNKYK